MGCQGLTENCIDTLSNAGSATLCELRVNVCADYAMGKIGRSQLVITHLMVGCVCCYTTDDGIDGVLEHGHKPA